MERESLKLIRRFVDFLQANSPKKGDALLQEASVYAPTLEIIAHTFINEDQDGNRQEPLTAQQWEQIERLFHEALQHGPGERTAFLDKACGNNAALRKKIEILLEADEQISKGELLKPPILSLLERKKSSVRLKPGSNWGHYKIVELIGQGGMGQVYKAEDPRLQRFVAIKVLPEHLADDEGAMRRFEREATSLAALSHPNIVTIHDVGVEQGVYFVVMEWLKGQNLRQRLGNSTLPWETAGHIASAISEGLSAAHHEGVIHRDLKPENIFLTDDGRVKILDFGVARRKEVVPTVNDFDSTKSVDQTVAGTMIGTIPYMSPEQVKGKQADIRSDVFSLGSVLYEMVAGKPPFLRNTEGEIIAAILKEDPPEIPGISEGLRRIIHRCLEKNPDDRFQSANDLALALKSIVQTENIQRRSVTAGRFFSKKLRTAIVLAFITLISALAWWWWTDQQSVKINIRSIAVLPLTNLSGDPEQEYFADGMTEAVIAQLAQIRALKVISRTSVMQYKQSQKSARQIGKELNVDALIEGSVMQSGNRVRITAQLINTRDDKNLWARSYERNMQDILSLQNEIARDITNKIRIEITAGEQQNLQTTSNINDKTYEAYLKGRYFWNKRSADSMTKAVQYFREAIDLEPTYAPAYVGLADCYIAHGGGFLGVSGKEAYAAAKAAITKALEIDPNSAEARTSFGSIKGEYEHDWAGAETEYKRAIELKPNYATAHQWYSDFLLMNGRLEEALAESMRALEIDPLSLTINTSVAIKLYILERNQLAVDRLQKTLEMDPNFYLANHFLGRTYLQMGKTNDALQSFTRSGAKAFIAYSHSVTGKKSQTKQILQQLMEQSKREYVNPFGLAVIHIGLGNQEEALNFLEIAYQQNVEEILFMKVDPLLAPVRSHPRFLDILRRLNLG